VHFLHAEILQTPQNLSALWMRFPFFALFFQERYNPIYHLSLILRQLLMVTGWPNSATFSTISSPLPERSVVIGIVEPPPVLAGSLVVSSETAKKCHFTRFLLGAIFV
jgi:hypothetical protein